MKAVVCADTVLSVEDVDTPRPAQGQLVLDVTLDRMKAGVFKFTARATADGELAVEAQLMCTVRRID